MFLLKELIKVSYVPLMLGGFLMAGLYTVANGFGYGSLLMLLLLAIGISFAAERLVPYEDNWNKDHQDRRRDLAHAVKFTSWLEYSEV